MLPGLGKASFERGLRVKIKIYFFSSVLLPLKSQTNRKENYFGFCALCCFIEQSLSVLETLSKRTLALSKSFVFVFVFYLFEVINRYLGLICKGNNYWQDQG